MNKNYKTLLLSTACAFLLVACGPKKEEQAPAASEQMEQKAEPKAPAVVPAPAASEGNSLISPSEKAKDTLTPEQKEKLKIEEENVFDENVPG